ncbi:hypothetical protein J437_LFUL019475 [Ladona fulva]|uniref:Uncharacterized protein n=1 Tax=Ladona fulva TaxID=123851 RepID=A0A8K0KUM7_LADFU|nr:hypothetical protein J437_LFUL019475 [Ladona fulva]
MAPKHLNCGSKIIEIAAFLAAGIYNDGYNFILQIMNDLQLQIGPHCKQFAETYDAHRKPTTHIVCADKSVAVTRALKRHEKLGKQIKRLY